MKQLDVFYRAWLNYRTITTKSRECSLFRRSITAADAEREKLSVIRNVCQVDEDWIEEIEKGLIYVEKAIKEERQFIYSNGEVVPIEKVKHISKDSVQHLARHSNLITREQTTDNIIPDKLYSVERLNDYTVYENRFLYMLLCYLRDFVTIRYDKILEISNKYEGSVSLNKTVVTPDRRVTYNVELHEERRNDKYLREHNTAKTTIDRIDLILKSILALLATPLMECVSKVAMLKPPITKTNVLKMDNNFKAAVALYEYLLSYDKDGYSFEPRNVEISPLGDNLGDEFSDVCSLISFLTYEHGLDIGAVLKKNYDRDEAERKDGEYAQKTEQLEALKRKMLKSEVSPEEYILSLEKQLKLAESRAVGAEKLREEIFELKSGAEALRLEIKEDREKIKILNEEIAETERSCESRIESLSEEHRIKMNEVLEKHEAELNDMVVKNNDRIREMNDQMSAERSRFREDLSAAMSSLSDKTAEYNALEEKYETLADENTLCEAKLKALRLEKGLVGKDETFTEKESFEELEREYSAFTRFYEQQWKETKKGIRKKHLKYENLKGRNGKED